MDMKRWKLYSGIASIALPILIILIASYQTSTMYAYETMPQQVATMGAMGMMFMMVPAGIVSIVSRNSQKNAGNIAILVLYILAVLIGLYLYIIMHLMAGSGIVLLVLIWNVVCLIMCGMAISANKKD